MNSEFASDEKMIPWDFSELRVLKNAENTCSPICQLSHSRRRILEQAVEEKLCPEVFWYSNYQFNVSNESRKSSSAINIGYIPIDTYYN